MFKGPCEKVNTNYLQKYDKTNVINSCIKVLSYLYNLILRDFLTYEEVGCKYVYYWLYYDVMENNKFNSFTLRFNTELIEKYAQMNIFMCKIYVKGVTEDFFKNIKQHYDLYDMFHKFKDYNSKPTEEHCNYGEHCSKSYKNLMDNYCKNEMNVFCEFIAFKPRLFRIKRMRNIQHKEFNKLSCLSNYETTYSDNGRHRFLYHSIKIS
ncbi:PIR Superfamily Protein [Plasmodium ovale wallikeri]|uniref:PIR Superfamily Protein n=1 Tax=Plasmodium ovale wallikeri TaxID=864142 RepID=A0A1A9AQZ6_PLAOA|nr:PIR Superfamily Protein [Plasmodium ovale wallikeri]SBT59117.1 PIR Superfamily Protein [Plasmodium ovale wallikeri]